MGRARKRMRERGRMTRVGRARLQAEPRKEIEAEGRAHVRLAVEERAEVC